MLLNTYFVSFCVELRDLKFLRATNLSMNSNVCLVVRIHPGTGQFEITEAESVVVTGFISKVDEVLEQIEVESNIDTTATLLDTKSFYKELQLRGYHYKGQFKRVIEARTDGRFGKIQWHSNFVTFIDCMMQVSIISQDTRSLMIPTAIDRVRIDPNTHFRMAKNSNTLSRKGVNVEYIKENNLIKAGGVEILGLHATIVARKNAPGNPILEHYTFVPQFPTPKLSLADAARVVIQMSQEITRIFSYKIVEVESDKAPIIQAFQNALAGLPLVTSEATLLTPDKNHKLVDVQILNKALGSLTGCHCVIGTNMLCQSDSIKPVLRSLKNHGFIVSRETETFELNTTDLSESVKLICKIKTFDESWFVLHYDESETIAVPKVIKVSFDPDYKWLDKLKRALANHHGSLVLVAQNEALSGLLGLVNCVRQETNGQSVKCFLINDSSAPEFKLDEPLYKDQLSLGLSINVYRNVSFNLGFVISP